MEGASGSPGPKNFNRNVIVNAQKLFGVLQDEKISSEDKLKTIEEVLKGVEVDIDVPDEYYGSNTLLHKAVSNGFVDVVKLLLKYNAEVNIRNAEGETPLHIAVANSSVEMVKLLLYAKKTGVGEQEIVDNVQVVDANIKNVRGETPLHIAVAKSSIEMVKLLVYAKKAGVREQEIVDNVQMVDVNIKNAKGETPLHLVFSEKRINRNKFGKPIMQMLLGCDADVTIQNNDSKTTLDLAKETENKDIIDLFESSIKKRQLVKKQNSRDESIEHADTSSVEANDRDKVQVQQVADAIANLPKTYSSSGAKKSAHETDYQLCLLMMFAIRALVKGYRFILGTEVDEAEQFDDIVFKYQIPKTDKFKSLFLAAKSKANKAKGIGLNELLKEDNKAPFSLLKYYKSYIKIRISKEQEADDIDFAICTNTHFNFAEQNVLVGNNKKLSFVEVSDTYREFFSEGQCYKLVADEKTLEWLKDDFIQQLENEKDKLEKKTQESDDVVPFSKEKGKKEKELVHIISCLKVKPELRGTLVKFLDNLIFVVGQTANITLAKTELSAYSKTNLVDTDFLTDAFYNQIFYWFSHDEGVWLPNEKIDEMIGTICKMVHGFASSISQMYAEKLRTSPIKFNDDKKDELNQWISENTIVHLITPVETMLAPLQVAQALEHSASYKAQGSFIFVHLRSLLLCEFQEPIISAFESPRIYDLLVIDCLSKKEDVTERELETLRDKLFLITKNDDRKKLIFIAPEEHKLAEMFKTHTSLYSHKVKNCFQDFTEKTRDEFLTTKVTFQGKHIKLNRVIEGTELQLLQTIPLETLIRDEGLVIGTEIPISPGYNESYYIDRSVRYQTVIKAGIFQDKSRDKFYDTIASTEPEFQELCENEPKINIHLLDQKGDRIIWVKSQGEISALRPYIDNRNILAFSEDVFLDSVKLQRVIIISDSAGMGKSTILDRISKKLKVKCKGTLILRIDLNKHTKALKKQSITRFNNTSAMDFLLKLLKQTTPLERTLLELQENCKSVLMFDGFDEISPDYSNQTLDLIENLIEGTKAQIWITTRPFMTEKLENSLQQFSYTLEPFCEQNQEDFLFKYWKHVKEIQDPDEDKIRVFARSLVEHLSKKISDKEKEFTGIPLQMRMLAECFLDDVEKSTDVISGFNLVELYQKFTKLKFYVLQAEKYEIEESKVGSRQSMVYHLYMKQHRWYALSEILPEDTVDFLFSKSKIMNDLKEIESNLNKIGIVTIIDGVPNFIHRTFAEYIVAVFFMKLIITMDSLIPEVQDFIISKLLISANFAIIRAFVNGLLPNNISSNKSTKATLKRMGTPVDPFSRYLERNKIKTIEQIFIQTASEGNLHVFVHLLDCVKSHQEILQTLLQCTDGASDKTILHLAAENNDSGFVNKFLNCTRYEIDHGQDIANFMLPAADIEGRSAIQVASLRGNTEVVKTLLQWTRDNIDQWHDIVKQMLLLADNECVTALMAASKWGKIDLVLTLLEWTLKNMDCGQDLVTQMLLSTSKKGDTALMMASSLGNNDVVLTLLMWTHYNIDQGKDLVKHMLVSANIHGDTALHLASNGGKSDVVKTILQWTRDNIDQGQEMVKQLLLSANDNGNAPLCAASISGSNEAVSTLMQWTCDNMDQGQCLVEQMLLWDEILPSQKTQLVSSSLGNDSVFQTYQKYPPDKTDQRHNNESQILLKSVNEGNTALFKASHQGYSDVVQTLVQWTRYNMCEGKDLVKRMLLKTDTNGLTTLHAESVRRNKDVVPKLLQWTLDNMDDGQEVVKQMLLSVDNDGVTPLLTASSQDNNVVVHELLQWTRDNMDQGQTLVKQMILSIGNSSLSAILTASSRKNFDLVQTLLQWARYNMDQGQEVVKQMLLSTDNKGLSALRMASSREKNDAVLALLQWTHDNMDQGQEVVMKMLLSTDNKGLSALHMASSQEKNDVVLLALLQWARDNLDQCPEVVMKMLLATDNRGLTTLHMASSQKKNDVVLALLQWTHDNLDQWQDLVREMLLWSDNNGLTALLTASRQKGSGVAETMRKWILDNMDHGEQLVKEMSRAADNSHTILLEASKEGDWNEVLAFLSSKCDMANGQNVVKRMLLTPNKKGLTTLLAVSRWRNENVIQKLLQWTRDNMDHGSYIVKQMLLAADNKGSTILWELSRKGNTTVVETLLQWTRDNMDQGQDVVKNMLLAADNKGDTALHITSRQGKSDMVLTLLQWTRGNMDEETLSKLLTARSKDDSTAMDLAVKENKVAVVDILNQYALN